MPTLVVDQHLEKQLRAERVASGSDRYDEVWEALYVINPMPNDEHQQLVSRFSAIFQDVIDWPGFGDVRPGVNVSDREHDWRENYRVPDVAVFLESGTAQNCREFWCGGPDFAIEVVSEGDRTRDKLPFYSTVGVRELLIIERRPWSLELLRIEGNRLVPVANSSLQSPLELASEVLPFTFQLQPGTPRPSIAVTCVDSERHWHV